MPTLTLSIIGPLGQPQVQDLRLRLGTWLEALGAPRDDIYATVCVLDEFGSNLMEHSGATWIELKASTEDGRIHIRLRDNGKLFDPTAKVQQDYTEYLRGDTDRKLGLFLVGRMTDELKYEREEPGGINCLTFLLKFKGWEVPS